MQEMKFTTRLACVSLCVYISMCLPVSICKCEYLCISLYLLASLYIPDWKCFSVCTYMHTHLWVHISAYVPMCGPVSTSISMQLCILFLCDLWVCFWYELFCLSMCVLGVGSTSVVVPVFVYILQGKWDRPFIVTISSKVGERNIWLITVSQLYPPLLSFLEVLLITSEMWEREAFRKRKRNVEIGTIHMETLSIQISPK